jgi:hypothetical protein
VLVIVTGRALDELIDQGGLPGAGAPGGDRSAGAELGGETGEHSGQSPGSRSPVTPGGAMTPEPYYFITDSGRAFLARLADDTSAE